MEAAPAPEPQRGGNPIPAIIAGGAIGKAIAIKGERSFLGKKWCNFVEKKNWIVYVQLL